LERILATRARWRTAREAVKPSEEEEEAASWRSRECGLDRKEA
jgi:hypothetical protein